jgi:hypothetical protein
MHFLRIFPYWAGCWKKSTQTPIRIFVTLNSSCIFFPSLPFSRQIHKKLNKKKSDLESIKTKKNFINCVSMGKDKQHIQVLQANMRQALGAGALSGIAVDSVLHPLGWFNETVIWNRMYSCCIIRYHQDTPTITGWICGFWRISRCIFWFIISSYRKCS